jgi:hypothetical protein
MLFTLWEQKFKNRGTRVRFSNPNDFEQQCADFITAINSKEEWSQLTKLHLEIESYFSERPFIAKEYQLKSKVMRVYYSKQTELLPRV